MQEQNLKDKTVKGVGWSAVDNIAQYTVSFVVGIVLARLLSPDDYGLIGIITIFTNVCMAIVNSDLSTALIRKKDISDEDYNTAFMINMAFGIFFYLLLFCCAPYIASFFNRTELSLLIRVSSITLIIGACSIVQQTRLTKQINFRTQTKITIVASVISGAVGVSMAFLGYGVWSLVFQTITSQIIRTACLCIYNKWFPKLQFCKKSFEDLFGFSWKMTVAHLLDTVWKELYQVVVGKFYSPYTLGQYTRAKSFSNLFSSNLTNVIQRVTYPVLSVIQDDESRLREAYRKIIKTTMYITFICMFGLAAVSEPLILCLIGEKWKDAANYLPFICVVGSLYPLHAINLNILKVRGRSDLFLILEIIKKIISVFPLLVGIFIGIYPMLIASIVIGIVCFFINSYYSGKMIGYTSIEQIKDVCPSLFLSVIIGALVYLLHYLPVSCWIVLPIQLAVISILVIIFSKVFDFKEYAELRQIITGLISKNRK